MKIREQQRNSGSGASASGVDALVDELKGDGQEVPRSFTISREKAREKVQEHLLPEAEGYVLLLVQAFVQRGATRLEFRIDSDDLELECDGEPLSEADFEGLYDAVLGVEETEARPGLRELALGLLSSLKMGPEQVRVVSGDGEMGAELVLGPDGQETYGEVDPAPEGTRVHVKMPLRGERVRSRLTGQLPEVGLLKERCQYASIPVLLNGRDIAGGLSLGDEIVCRVSVTPEKKSQALQGEAGYLPGERRRQQLRLVRHGVWVDTRSPRVMSSKKRLSGFVALVEANALRLDLSSSQVVKDDVFKQAVKAATTAYRETFDCYDVFQLIGRRRRKMVDPALEGLARSWHRREVRVARGLYATLSVVLLAGVAAALWGALQIPETWRRLALLIGFGVGAVGAIAGGIRVSRLFVPKSRIHAAFDELFPKGWPLRQVAEDILWERRDSREKHWRRLSKLIRRED